MNILSSRLLRICTIRSRDILTIDVAGLQQYFVPIDSMKPSSGAFVLGAMGEGAGGD